MGRIKTIARRTFLIGSAAIVGGVAFGIYAVRTPHDNPLEAGLKDGEATFNPFVKIDADHITLILPHHDKGQGAVSAQAALVAEEMDIDLDQFTLDFGQPDGAYYNTALANDAVPFMSTDESWLANTMRGTMGGMMKLLGLQTTGGSSTVPDSFDKLRKAGAIARETLKAAAAQRTGIAIADLQTKSAAVVLPDGTEIPYTDLAADAANIDAITDVTLRDPSEWRLLGKPMQRVDMVAKSTGTQAYGIDVELDGMLHAAVRLNPGKGAARLRMDRSKVVSTRGVEKILYVTNGVAVVADNTWRAFQAVNALAIEWRPAPYPLEQQDHWNAVSAALGSDDHLDKVWRDDGDVDDDTLDITAAYSAGYAAHQPLEPLNATVKVTEDGVDIWTGHQIQGILAQKVAAITGHDVEQVRHHNTYSGGSFGHRLEFSHAIAATEIANQMRGKPIKLTLTREEDFAQDFNRQISVASMAGSVRDGKIQSLDLKIAMPSVVASQAGRLGYPIPGPDSQIVSGAWNASYAIPNFRVSGYRADELAPVSSWRSVGASTNGFMLESAMDELIHAAGADPLAERIRLCSDDVTCKVLEAVGEMSDWGAPLAANQGRGLALVDSFGVPTAEVVQVTATNAGIKIDKVWVALDVGTIIDPVNFDNNVKGGVIWGLGHAMNAEITYSDGIAEPTNFYAHDGMRIHQCPDITVRGLENSTKIRGVGEPPVPPAPAALANAIFAATGKRVRNMPFINEIDFV